jgi:hypothetical protein
MGFNLGLKGLNNTFKTYNVRKGRNIFYAAVVDSNLN